MRILVSRLISIRCRPRLGHRWMRVHALRAWLNEADKHAPARIDGHMYGLLLRPVDRPDLFRRA